MCKESGYDLGDSIGQRCPLTKSMSRYASSEDANNALFKQKIQPCETLILSVRLDTSCARIFQQLMYSRISICSWYRALLFWRASSAHGAMLLGVFTS